MSWHEYRVVWQREGLSKRREIRQTLAGAQRLALVIEGRIEEATGCAPGDYACCDGMDCTCAGESNTEAWARNARNIPALVYGPVIEARSVSAWARAEEPVSSVRMVAETER